MSGVSGRVSVLQAGMQAHSGIDCCNAKESPPGQQNFETAQPPVVLNSPSRSLASHALRLNVVGRAPQPDLPLLSADGHSSTRLPSQDCFLAALCVEALDAP